jgi:hypothetical protein
MKLNMGCGNNQMDDFINVDNSKICNPDLVLDLEILPWPWSDNSVEEVVFNHCLEHLGRDPKIFLEMIKELYRICKNDALIRITVPHPRHDHFINDPTHVRPISPQLLSLFSKRLNDEWKEKGISNTPLAHQLGVDFEIILPYILDFDEPYKTKILQKLISQEDLETALRERNNVATEYRIELRVSKDASSSAATNLMTAFLFEPEWSGNNWENILLCYLETFLPGEPVALIIPLGETISLKDVENRVLSVALDSGRETFADVVLMDHHDNLLHTLRRYQSLQWITSNENQAQDQLTGPFGQRFARALTKSGTI